MKEGKCLTGTPKAPTLYCVCVWLCSVLLGICMFGRTSFVKRLHFCVAIVAVKGSLLLHFYALLNFYLFSFLLNLLVSY